MSRGWGSSTKEVLQALRAGEVKEQTEGPLKKKPAVVQSLAGKGSVQDDQIKQKGTRSICLGRQAQAGV